MIKMMQNVSPKEFSKLHIGWFDENSPFCIMRLSTGSANNLKPEAVMKAFCDEKKWNTEDLILRSIGLNSMDRLMTVSLPHLTL